MNKKQTKQAIAVMQAFVDGQEIEIKFDILKLWSPATSPSWDWASHQYRIKSKPTYVPWTFDNVPVGAVISSKSAKYKTTITATHKSGVDIGLCCATFEELFNDYTLLDGSPCGTLKQ